ncbi:hypothetical protein Goklo_012217, partial [Gossypium klotzschianum]|nr:hypothetical protein [Gossypium klotzschianum]
MKWLKRGIGQHGSCSLYQHGDEDLIHVLRDCPVAREVWLHVVLVELQSMFFAGNWIQLYIDGIVMMDVGFAAARGLCSVFDAKLWGILHGLILVQKDCDLYKQSRGSQSHSRCSFGRLPQ